MSSLFQPTHHGGYTVGAPAVQHRGTSRAAAASISGAQLSREARAVVQALAEGGMMGDRQIWRWLVGRGIIPATTEPSNIRRARIGLTPPHGNAVKDSRCRAKGEKGRDVTLWELTRKD